MSDERRRELERAWRASGDPLDGAALLRERVRLGELEPRRVALAAYLGDPAARAAAPDVPVPADAGSLHEWLAAAPWAGPPTWVHAALGLLRFARSRATLPDPQAEPHLDRAEQLVARALAEGRTGASAREAAREAAGPLHQLFADRMLAQLGVIAGGGDAAGLPGVALLEPCLAALELLENPGRVETLALVASAAAASAPDAPEGELREVVRGALLAWALPPTPG